MDAVDVPNPFAWSAKFDVGNAKMNDEHKGLFAGIDDCCKNPGDGGKLDALKGKVAAHFASEEAAMTGKGLLDGGHKGTHDEFLTTAGGLACPLSADTGTFMKKWLVHHILSSDIPTYGGKL